MIGPRNTKYLEGANLGLITRVVDCSPGKTGNELAGIAISANGSSFLELPNSQDITSPSVYAAISIPFNAICSSSGRRVNYLAFRNMKLFVPPDNSHQSERPMKLSYNCHRFSIDPLDTDAPTRSRNICDPGLIIIGQHVVSATLFNTADDTEVRTASLDGSSLTMVELSFSQRTTPPPLHGQLAVSSWKAQHGWSDELCPVKTDRLTGFYVAKCSHLTDFALIVSGLEIEPGLCDGMLMIFSVIVETLSIISLVTLLFLKFCKHCPYMRKIEYIKYWTISITTGTDSYLNTIYMVTLLAFFIIFTFFSTSTVTGSHCSAMAAVQYTLLISCIFLTVVRSLRTLASFSPSRYVEGIINRCTELSVAAFVATCLPVTITIVLAFTLRQFFDRNDHFCWIRPDYIYLGVVFPVTVVTVNGFLCLGIITFRFFPGLFGVDNTSHMLTRSSAVQKQKIIALLLIQFTLGTPWVLQYLTLFVPYVTSTHYLFTIVNGSQGTVLLCLFLYRHFAALPPKIANVALMHGSEEDIFSIEDALYGQRERSVTNLEILDSLYLSSHKSVPLRGRRGCLHLNGDHK
ncbi:hypothetical protein AB6A40_000913 [Gnathostoma spinigerum]|uniref:G-protein coupled receptors family 2 profile 2 domain-containing protein n=1 Tax=Gnathostoma spinigerum TaxID=75299 RepID=A0ABD6E303_9BILA